MKHSIELLMDAIDGETEEKQILLDADLQERDSVAEIGQGM